MKIKKIKNLILTFVICLFGALAFNSIKTKAGYFYNYFTYNEMDVYKYGNGENYITITGTGVNGQYNILLLSYSGQATTQYNNCIFTPYEGAYTGDLVVGTFNCSGFYLLNYDTSKSYQISESWATSYVLRTTSNNSNTQESVYSSYIINNNGGGKFDYQRRLTSEYYDEIYNSGYDWGYDKGYYDALEDSVDVNRNSLVGMIGAIFTGPVTMLQSVFNFNILGVNFAEMLLGLTTLLVVIWLVKRFV